MKLHQPAVCAAILMIAAAPVPKLKKSDQELILGKWKVTAAEERDKPSEEKQILEATLEITKERILIHEPDGGKETASYKLDPSKKPAQIAIMPDPNEILLGIYELKGGVLKICFAKGGRDRPATFKTREGSREVMITLQRIKK